MHRSLLVRQLLPALAGCLALMPPAITCDAGLCTASGCVTSSSTPRPLAACWSVASGLYSQGAGGGGYSHGRGRERGDTDSRPEQELS